MDLEVSDSAAESSSSASTTVTTVAEEQEINSPVLSAESHMRRPSLPKRRKSDGIRSWLFELGLSHYATVFELHDIDDESLPLLTLKDLKDMGITALGPRKLIHHAIQKLKKWSQWVYMCSFFLCSARSALACIVFNSH